MSVSKLENPTQFMNMDPHVLYSHVNKAYEEFKHKFQRFDSSQVKIYRDLYSRLRKMKRFFNQEDTVPRGDPVYFLLIQEISQFMLELELSPYL
jgi:hypothetical protein